MYNFQYANPTRVCFGEGQIASLPDLIPAGSRLLVLYGGGSIKQTASSIVIVMHLRDHDDDSILHAIQSLPLPIYDSISISLYLYTHMLFV